MMQAYNAHKFWRLLLPAYHMLLYCSAQVTESSSGVSPAWPPADARGEEQLRLGAREHQLLQLDLPAGDALRAHRRALSRGGNCT